MQKIGIRITGNSDHIEGYTEIILGILTVSGVLIEHKERRYDRRNDKSQVYLELELMEPPLDQFDFEAAMNSPVGDDGEIKITPRPPSDMAALLLEVEPQPFKTACMLLDIACFRLHSAVGTEEEVRYCYDVAIEVGILIKYNKLAKVGLGWFLDPGFKWSDFDVDPNYEDIPF